MINYITENNVRNDQTNPKKSYRVHKASPADGEEFD